MTADERERLRATFDEAAEVYERARPRYPVRLYDDLAELAGLGDAALVLEIGCGTGQATRELARRSYRVLCIELGPSLAAVARRQLARFPNVDVVTSAFETWDPRGARFDLVFAATSWHWLDPDVRFAKAAHVLEPDGRLAIVTTSHVSADDADPFFGEIQDAYVALGEERTSLPLPDDVADARADIEASGLFDDVAVRRYVVEHPYTAEEYVAVLETYSGHRAMEPSAREYLYGEVRRLIGERRIRKHYLFTLHVARRPAL